MTSAFLILAVGMSYSSPQAPDKVMPAPQAPQKI